MRLAKEDCAILDVLYNEQIDKSIDKFIDKPTDTSSDMSIDKSSDKSVPSFRNEECVQCVQNDDIYDAKDTSTIFPSYERWSFYSPLGPPSPPDTDGDSFADRFLGVKDERKRSNSDGYISPFDQSDED